MPMRVAEINLARIRANLRRLSEITGSTPVMAVVKADGYGHGASAVARAALDAGAAELGTADLEEALRLRHDGIKAPILAWLIDLDDELAAPVAHHIQIGISNSSHLGRVAAAARTMGQRAIIQIKVDTGLARNGAPPPEWHKLFRQARRLEVDGTLQVRGMFSHLANTSSETDRQQLHSFNAAVASATAAGLTPSVRHIASTAAAIRTPQARYDLVRIGIGLYGISPFPDFATGTRLGLIPAMRLRSRVVAVRPLAAGAGVSYGYTWRAPRDTRIALIPLGYADGIPRLRNAPMNVSIGGALAPVVGAVAMDQMTIDVGGINVSVGDDVVVWGSPLRGEPSVEDWARSAETIGYELVSRVGTRAARQFVDHEEEIK